MLSATREEAVLEPFIPVSTPNIDEAELGYLRKCIETGWISSEGPFVARFEEAWAGYCGRRHGVAVCNGTGALEAALAVLDLRPGDEVIVPTFTMISCVRAILAAEATPVLVDVDPHTWCMDLDQVEKRLSPATRAVMAVHIYGHPVAMAELVELCERSGVLLIEDAAEAHGAEVLMQDPSTWLRCGSFGSMSAFSFYANKIVTTGEGGMVLTDDDRLRERLRGYRNLYFGGDTRFRHESLGANLRMTNLQAALGLAQVERIGRTLARKRQIAARYSEALRASPGLTLPVERPWARSVYWVYGVVLDESTGLDGKSLAKALRARGIDSRPFFLGMHEQPALTRAGWFAGERYPVAERLARQGIYLPSGCSLGDAEVDRVCGALGEVLAG